ncbi:uncharacterized protein [Halyomorpha halys]|uniref:uncharacterized protein isoform X3 n=1 Tax=Halyomorpha halys TaxID=286706 RepID=UPI0006D50420|nr:uncharacterized protein LOC106688370 isoform X2 [Halyomorpha halys]
MDFICEEDPCNQVDDQYYELETNLYGDPCDEDEPVRDPMSIVSQMHCQEAQARKSDLQLACKLDELAKSFRSGTPPNFIDEATCTSPSQTLNDFLCMLEKRLVEKTQAQEEDCQDVAELDCEVVYAPKTPSPKMRMKQSSLKRRLDFTNASARPGPSTSMRSRTTPAATDWASMLNDSNEIICYPSERLSMYGSTSGDIWKRRAEGKAGCKCASPVRTPVRQVQAIPIRCVPSPRFEDESLLSAADLTRPEYCGCTTEDILRKKRARRSASTRCDNSMNEEMPSWRRRKLDESAFWKSKRSNQSHSHSYSRSSRLSPHKKKVAYADMEEDRGGTPEYDIPYQSFKTGLTPCVMSSPKTSSCRRALECLECSSPEVMALMRESSLRSPCTPHASRSRSPCPKTPIGRRTGSPAPRRPTPMKMHLVPPTLTLHRMDDSEF